MRRLAATRNWLLLFPLFLIVTIFSASISQANEPPPQPLFLSSPETPLVPPAPTDVRYRPVTVNTAILGESSGQPALAASRLILNLFADVQYTAVRDQAQHNLSGSFSWMGHLEGIPYSQVSLVLKDGVLVGIITSPEGIYEVRYYAGATHLVYELDQAAFPDEHEDDYVEVEENGSAAATSFVPTDDGSIIDVMVFYSINARNGAGGTAAIENTIDLAIDWTNTSYQNSQVIHRLNLVHKAEVTYSDSGSLSTDLSRLRGTSDGYMDEIHALRNTHRADLVALIVESPGCGIAYIMTNVSPTFESSGFSVTMRSCAVGNYTFGHELGHNMSARHDWIADPTNNSPFTYNHGHIAPGNLWRTIMSYGSSCGDCPRLGYWSNPDVLYNGIPMGIPQGQPQAADNRLTLNNTALTVANFRQSQSPITPTPSATPTPTVTPTPTQAESFLPFIADEQ